MAWNSISFIIKKQTLKTIQWKQINVTRIFFVKKSKREVGGGGVE